MPMNKRLIFKKRPIGKPDGMTNPLFQTYSINPDDKKRSVNFPKNR